MAGTMRFWAISLLILSACKPSPTGEAKADPAVQASLDSCKVALEDNQKVRRELEEKLHAAEGGEVVVKIDGDLLRITGKGPNGRVGETAGAGDAKDEELYQNFIASVKKSRSAMEQCYRRALKNDSGLQARTLSVSISVNYAANGKVQNASANPRVSDSFNSCIEGVTKNWTLPAMPKPTSFKAPLTLTPEG